MRKEIDIWFKQDEYDFETAIINFENKRYSTAAFLLQQAIEKCLKAFYFLKKELPPKHIH